MFAALYGNVDQLRALLDAGAGPNVRNEAGATALLWAVDDLAKTRLLIERGADVNARSLDGRTPLVVAAGRANSSDVLRVLLDKGADPRAELNGVTALTEAAYAADVAAMRLLLGRGADPKQDAIATVVQAAESDCAACIELLLPSLDADLLSRAALAILPPNDDGDVVQAGLLTAAFSLSASILRVCGGIASNKLGGLLIAQLSFVVVAAGSLVIIAGGASIAAAFTGQMLLALGMGVANAAVFKLVPRFTPKAVGGAAGIIGGLRAFGGFALPPILGIFVRLNGEAGYSQGFAVFFGLAIAGLIFLKILKKYTEAELP